MKKEKALILLIDSNESVRNALNFMLRSDFNFEVIDVDSENFDYSKKLLRTRDVKMIVSEHSEKVDGLSLVELMPEGSLYISTSGDDPIVQKTPNITKLERKKALNELKKLVGEKFEIDPIAEVDDYTSIPFKTLVAFPGIANHLFIQLPSGRRLKIYQQGDKILPVDVEKYAAKGVTDLWIDKKAYTWVMKKMEENFERMVEDENFNFDDDEFNFDEEDFSFDADDSAPVALDDEFGDFGDMDDDFDFDMGEDTGGIKGLGDIPTLADEIKKKNSKGGGSLDYDQMFGKDKKSSSSKERYQMSSDAEVTMDDLDRELAELDAGFQENPFTKEQEFLKEVNSKVQTVLKKVSKNRNMAALFKQLKINREEGSYIKTRINLVVHLSTTIAKELQWASPATFEKLIYVAHVHDIALFEKPILAKAQSVIDLEIIKGITDEDKQHFLPHVEKAVALIKADPWAPEGADKIVEQHHEKPDRSGFPNQLTHQRVVPFAALLAISIDCAQYMIDNPNWDIATWVDKNEKKWKGGSYTKVMGGLKKLATQIEKAA